MNRIEELEAEVARFRERVADLEEALDMLAKALEKARAALLAWEAAIGGGEKDE